MTLYTDTVLNTFRFLRIVGSDITFGSGHIVHDADGMHVTLDRRTGSVPNLETAMEVTCTWHAMSKLLGFTVQQARPW